MTLPTHKVSKKTTAAAIFQDFLMTVQCTRVQRRYLGYHGRTMLGSLGLPEIILILVLALLIFGPKRLPEMGRTIGKGLAEFRKASTDFKRTINAELALDEGEQTRTTRRPPVSGALAVLDSLAEKEPPAGTAARESAAPVAPAPEPEPETPAN